MVRIDKFTKERLRRKACQSYCRIRVAAMGMNRNGDIVSIAYNISEFIKKGGGIHAEERIMHEARDKGIVQIIVCRINRTGKFLPIDPCERCQKHAERLGIRITTVPAEESK